MGYLAYGAMSGLGGEYLKQSEEQRIADRQKIRDERLNEFQLGQIERRAELTTQENIRAEGVASQEAELERKSRETQADLDRKSREKIGMHEGGFTLKEGENRYDAEGNLIAEGRDRTFAPTAASTAWEKFKKTSVKLRGSGTMVEMDKMMEQWRKQAYYDKRDDLGQVIQTNVRNPDIEDFPIWLNARVSDEDRIDVLDPKYINADPNKMWEYAQRQPHFNVPGGPERAIESIRKMHDWWNPPSGEGGAEKKDPLDDPRVASPDPNKQADASPAAMPGTPGALENPNAMVQQKQQGMLGQSQGPSTLDASSQELEAMVNRLKGEIQAASGRLGDSSRIPMLQQQLQQYQMLLERARMEEAQNPRAQAGPASVVANRPTPTATTVAQR